MSKNYHEIKELIKRLRNNKVSLGHGEYGVDPLCELAANKLERLEAEIKTAIRQFEDGNRLECHRTLCTAVYGKQH